MRILILADDLIWSTRLASHARAAGAEVTSIRTFAALGEALPNADAVIVDLTSRAYDGVAAVRQAAAGRRVMAVGQHDDIVLRRKALDAGAERVHPYRKLFEDGPATIEKWLDSNVEAPAR